MRISDWSSDVCSSDLEGFDLPAIGRDFEKRSDIAAKQRFRRDVEHQRRGRIETLDTSAGVQDDHPVLGAVEDRFRSEAHTSELQSLMRISYAVFCLKKKKHPNHIQIRHS